MIVELKAPSVKIGMNEIGQVERYMYDIEQKDKFSKNEFSYKIFLISSELTKYGKSKVGKNVSMPTFYDNSKDHDIEIHITTWSDIIARNRHKLSYLGQQLKTKDVDTKTYLETSYPSLDISNIPLSTTENRN
jgi:hypothetical protein